MNNPGLEVAAPGVVEPGAVSWASGGGARVTTTKEPDQTSQRRVLFWTLYLCFWTLVGLAFTLQAVVFRSGQGHPVGWVRALLMSLPDWYLWAALSPLIFQLSRRFPLSRKRWPRSLLVHLPASAAFFFAYLLPIIALDYYVIWNPHPESPFLSILWSMAVRSAAIGMLVYWGIVALSHALDYYAKYRERELAASRLEAQLFQTQLQMLRMQLQPHFLFNTLHAVITLMHKDVDRAERMLIRLADLLRLTLDRSSTAKIPLAQELEFLDKYLEIEKTRFGERLSVNFEIPEPVREALVPNLILQPLVENAIRHGLAPRPGPGRITIRARRDEGHLRIEIQDDGLGNTKPSGRSGSGVGLSNTRRRLEQLYGERQRLDLTHPAEGGTLVILIFPFQTEEAEP